MTTDDLGPADPSDPEPDADADTDVDVDAGRYELDGVVRSIADHARTVNLTRAAGLASALERAGSGQLTGAGRDEAAELAHQLVGSAGTFGFSGVSDLASELGRFFRTSDFDEAGVDWARQRMSALLEQLASEPDD